MDTLVLADSDLIARLTMFEDSFVERKSKGDKGGWLRSTVAFANSTPIGYPAVLLIGVDDSGEIAPNINAEDLMKSYSDYIGEHVWPPIYTAPRSLRHNEKSCVAVIVPGSSERPHFAGKSYVRLGTQTKEASEVQFAELIARTNSKTREIARWIEIEVTVARVQQSGIRHEYTEAVTSAFVGGCNYHYVTLRDNKSEYERSRTYSLSRVELEFDGANSRLTLRIYPGR